MSSCVSIEQLFQWKLELDSRKLLKWKEEIDSLNLKTQQLGVDLHALKLELKRQREIEQAVVSTEKTQNPEGNEVNFDLPPRFDENEDHEEETTKEEEKRVPEEEEEKIQEEKTIIPTPIVSFKLPPKSPHNQSVQLSLFHTHDQPPLTVLKPVGDWKTSPQSSGKLNPLKIKPSTG